MKQSHMSFETSERDAGRGRKTSNLTAFLKIMNAPKLLAAVTI